MPCFHPLKGYRSAVVNPSTGKRGLVFKNIGAFTDLPVTVSCGNCLGCRLDRSQAWAIRCYHELQSHSDNCFITLTYDDEHLPIGNSLCLSDFQKFMKRLRKRYGAGIRFFHCGEYGPLHARPHYHAILFNHNFDDKLLWSRRDDILLYTSAALEELWPFGFSSVGDATFESAAYVARYIMKKVTGKMAEAHYSSFDPSTGEIFTRSPEYITMSRRPGIGHEWLKKYESDIYPCDFVVVGDRKKRVPRYYDKIIEMDNGELLDLLKRKRVLLANRNAHDNTPERLAVRKEVLKSRLKQLPRRVE